LEKLGFVTFGGEPKAVWEAISGLALSGGISKTHLDGPGWASPKAAFAPGGLISRPWISFDGPRWVQRQT